MPLQTGESIMKEFTDGVISPEEAMERLLLLLSPKHAWNLYKDAVNVVSQEVHSKAFTISI